MKNSKSGTTAVQAPKGKKTLRRATVSNGESKPSGNGVSRRAAVLAPPPPARSGIGNGNGNGNGHNKAGAAGDHTLEKTELLHALLAFKKGDFSVRLPFDLEGVDGKIADAYNDVM